MKVLLTGFTVMHGWPSNCSEQLVASLLDDPLPQTDGLELCLEIIPAVGSRLQEHLDSLLRRHAVDCCLFLGQAAERNKLSVERFALNWKEYPTPDGSGACCDGEPVLPGAPAAYTTTLPVSPLLDALAAAGIPAQASSFAGTSLCNQLLFLALHRARDNGPATGFLHLPLLPEQLEGQWRKAPFMPLEMQRNAVAVILRTLQEELEV